MANTSDPILSNDVYFVATRMLTYQLLHQPHTATRSKIPLIVLLTSDVMPAKRARLDADGAITVEVDYVHTPVWLTGEQPQWKDIMTKLRAWQLAKIDRALFLDGDMILQGPLDGVFDAPGTGVQERMEPLANAKSVEDEVPRRYCFASMSEARPYHEYPPSVANGGFKEVGYFNAGFFVFGPGQEMFEYYSALLNRDDSFDPRYIEQNLLNYAHRLEGRLPWQEPDSRWNVRFPGMADWEGVLLACMISGGFRISMAA
ncbi:nucleotide-diphospho-sugar transferase [Delphinella strobiligena]|nr:nucleotide-diphospho-sugar transferase [Delphinella strobiligena]